MDERALFDLFHDALENEPRPGAYEQMRLALTNHPVALKRRPAYRTRWTKMRFRTAAALTAVVIAIALGAALAASRYAPVGSAPAVDGQTVKAYQTMMHSDYMTMANSTSNHCITIDDNACEAAAKRVVTALQQWVDHMDSFQTPSRYAGLDLQIRRHLKELIMELNAAVAFQKANDARSFRLAIDAALYERNWIDPVALAINGDYGRLANSYEAAFSNTKQALAGCIGAQSGLGGPCGKLARQPSCLGANAELCQAYVQDSESQMQTLLIMLMQNPPPADQVAKTSKLHGYLAEADTALLQITDAILKGDAAKVNVAQQAFAGALLHAGYTS
jgi:hypothetical protein